jgi:hypothetical protein
MSLELFGAESPRKKTSFIIDTIQVHGKCAVQFEWRKSHALFLPAADKGCFTSIVRRRTPGFCQSRQASHAEGAIQPVHKPDRDPYQGGPVDLDDLPFGKAN